MWPSLQQLSTVQPYPSRKANSVVRWASRPPTLQRLTVVPSWADGISPLPEQPEVRTDDIDADDDDEALSELADVEKGCAQAVEVRGAHIMLDGLGQVRTCTAVHVSLLVDMCWIRHRHVQCTQSGPGQP